LRAVGAGSGPSGIFARNMLSNLLPMLPNEPSFGSWSCRSDSIDAARDGEKGHVDPVNSPFSADTPDETFGTVAWEWKE
jgi:hypothetical protein